LGGGLETGFDESGSNDGVYIGNSLADAFADIGVFVSIAKLNGFMNTSGSTGRNSRTETAYFRLIRFMRD